MIKDIKNISFVFLQLICAVIIASFSTILHFIGVVSGYVYICLEEGFRFGVNDFPKEFGKFLYK